MTAFASSALRMDVRVYDVCAAVVWAGAEVFACVVRVLSLTLTRPRTAARVAHCLPCGIEYLYIFKCISVCLCATVPEVGDGPWTVPQRAFFIPYAYLESTWAWAQDNVGHLDVLLHPNTGCMHDGECRLCCGVWRSRW